MSHSLAYFRNVWQQRRKQTALPRFLTYIVTFTCNARCIMCDSWKKPSPNDLSLEEIDRIFGQLPRMDSVRLSGGEPFVRRDMLDIAHLAQDRLKPFFLHVTSNGFLTDRIVKFCEQRKRDIPLHLLISVDGVEDKHNQVRGHDQAWRYVMRTIEELAPRRDELGLRLAVNQTIVDAEGVEHYRLLREKLRPLGVHNHMVMAYDASATYNLDEEVDVAPTEIGQFFTFGDFTDAHLQELFDEVEKDLHQFPWMERLAKRYYMRGIRNRLLNRDDQPKTDPNPPCVALGSHMRLLPDGKVPTCQFNTRTVGSLREQSFEELWTSAATQKQRDWVHACPGCWAECEVLPSAIYTGDLMRQAWHLGKGTPSATPVPGADPERTGLPVLS